MNEKVPKVLVIFEGVYATGKTTLLREITNGRGIVDHDHDLDQAIRKGPESSVCMEINTAIRRVLDSLRFVL